jgi:hypothetical protein
MPKVQILLKENVYAIQKSNLLSKGHFGSVEVTLRKELRLFLRQSDFLYLICDYTKFMPEISNDESFHRPLDLVQKTLSHQKQNQTTKQSKQLNTT